MTGYMMGPVKLVQPGLHSGCLDALFSVLNMYLVEATCIEMLVHRRAMPRH